MISFSVPFGTSLSHIDVPELAFQVKLRGRAWVSGSRHEEFRCKIYVTLLCGMQTR